MPDDGNAGNEVEQANQTTTLMGTGETSAGGETPTWANYEEWLGQQSENVRKLVTEHFGGLKNALESERTERKKLAGDLKKAAAEMEAGSKARDALETTSARLEAAERQTVFYEQATRPEIGCTNVRLAYMAAREADAIDGKGRINWEVLKKDFPELFRKPAPPAANAGTGTRTQPLTGFDMNAEIRKAAGRQ